MDAARQELDQEFSADLDETAPLLTRDEILSVDDMKYEVVEVPEWGGRVRVKALTGTERDAFESSMVVGAGRNQKIVTENIRAKLVALTVVDARGQAMFTLVDITLLGRKSSAALDRVYEVGARLSKISSEDVEELAKNSGNGRSADSASV